MALEGGFGVVLKINVGSTLTAITHMEDVDYPEFEKILTEATGHDSAGGYAEWIATGKRQMNAFTCTLTWDVNEATHAAVVAAFDSDDAVGMSIEDPDGSEVISFDAHIAKLGRIAKQDSAYRCQVTIQPTGQPTIT